MTVTIVDDSQRKQITFTLDPDYAVGAEYPVDIEGRDEHGLAIMRADGSMAVNLPMLPLGTYVCYARLPRRVDTFTIELRPTSGPA